MSFQMYLDWDRLHNHYLISKRKKSALLKGMHITSMDDSFFLTDGSISFGVIGHTKEGYVVSFSKDNISCTCLDHIYRGHLGFVCKHIFFVIHLSKNNIIFDNTNYLKYLMNQSLIYIIRSSILKIIDIKKKEIQNVEQSVLHHPDRDSDCSICYESFKTNKMNKIQMCAVCKNSFHMHCIVTAWSYSSAKGNCPYCRAKSTDNKLLCDNNENDPWSNFNFNIEANEIVEQPIEANEIVEQPIEQPIVENKIVEQPIVENEIVEQIEQDDQIINNFIMNNLNNQSYPITQIYLTFTNYVNNINRYINYQIEN